MPVDYIFDDIIIMEQLLLNRNEVLQGPTPACYKTLRKFKRNHVNTYIDGYNNSILIPKISEEFSIPENQIILSYGIEDFLRMIFDNLQCDSSILVSEFHYSYYDLYAKLKGINKYTFRMLQKNSSFEFDYNDCVEKYKKYTPKLILIASPNNPTGNSISPDNLSFILSYVSNECLVIIDEAYFGFCKSYDQISFLNLLTKFHNLVLLRTFSKLYGLAGLRISFALCGNNVKSLLNYNSRYLGVSRILEEIAITALNSKKYYKNISIQIIKSREYLFFELDKIKGFNVFKSDSNFIFVWLNEEDIQILHYVSSKCERNLIKFLGSGFARITVGLPKDNYFLVNLIVREFKKESTIWYKNLFNVHYILFHKFKTYFLNWDQVK